MLLLFLVLEAIPLVLSQATHTVSVGVEGSVFDPPTLAAGANDTVEFFFLGDIHDVTQSNPQAPCSPLEGGFSSGFFGRGVNFTGPTVMWSLTITNASAPIWFFCAATRPVSHCGQGMVGAINPPSQDAYSSFQRAAKAVSGTPAFLPSLVLQGVGASATFPVTLTDSFPVPPPTSAPSAGASPSSSTNTGTPPSPTGTPKSSPSNHGAVIGGAVGGALGAVILLLISVILCYRIKRRRERSATDSSYFATYNPHSQDPFSPTTASNPGKSTTTSAAQSPNYITAFNAEREPNAMTQKQSLLHTTSAGTLRSEFSNSNLTTSGNFPLQPQRYNSPQELNNAGQPGINNATAQGFGAVYNNQPSINRDPSFQGNEVGMAEQHPSPPQNRTGSSSNSATANEAMDLKALAKEVAAVLRDEKAAQARGGGPEETTLSPTDSMQSAPPKYHTVNN